MGYHRAGFDVVGVDLDAQPNYPFKFYREDALDVLRLLLSGGEWHGYRLEDFAVIHGSPPCQLFSVMSKSWNGKAGEWPDLVAGVRGLLERTGKPYVIENVMGAPLLSPVKLCGSMFGLAVERHRLFESNVPLTAPACDHAAQALTWPDGFPALRTGRSDKRARVVGVFGTGGGPTKLA
jgi:DNA (cytosine-5)-methyltransferase 1